MWRWAGALVVAGAASRRGAATTTVATTSDEPGDDVRIRHHRGTGCQPSRGRADQVRGRDRGVGRRRPARDLRRRRRRGRGDQRRGRHPRSRRAARTGPLEVVRCEAGAGGNDDPDAALQLRPGHHRRGRRSPSSAATCSARTAPQAWAEAGIPMIGTLAGRGRRLHQRARLPDQRRRAHRWSRCRHRAAAGRRRDDRPHHRRRRGRPAAAGAHEARPRRRGRPRPGGLRAARPVGRLHPAARRSW